MSKRLTRTQLVVELLTMANRHACKGHHRIANELLDLAERFKGLK